jgi:hypothetical protein
MTAPALVTAASVREYLALNSTASTSKYTDATLGSNIRAATWTLERATGRLFADKTATLLFTTNGAAYLTIPGLRTATAVSLQNSALVADSTYWLTPDSQQTGVSTGIQLRAFGTARQGGPWWLSNPEWFDRNLDSPFYPGNYGGGTSLPNDLSIAGSWGYTAGSEPEPALHATKVLAAFYTLRPDAILAGAVATPDGGSTDLSALPVEVQQFIADWRVGPWAFGL